MVTKSKKIQKTIYIDEDVWEALEKQMKMTRNTNVSVLVNDGLRYAMFPEYRNDRDADLVKLYHQFSASLADHRKKTARDLAFLQEMMLQSIKNQYLAFPPVPEKDIDVKEADANVRLNHFMESIVRNMGTLKPISEREEKGDRMAQFYKVDNRLLSEEEYNEHCVGLWAVCLFIGGAIFCGYQLHSVIPHEWTKEVRFVALVIPSVIVGGIAARFAGFIRGMFFVSIALGFIGSLLWFVWDAV